MGEQQDRPLWEVMNEAYRRGYQEPASGLIGHTERVRLGHAAQLRAIADVVAPEEGITPMLPDGYDVTRARWEQRMATRALLLAEAERAEKGGGTGG
jgi:hypothetical protein